MAIFGSGFGGLQTEREFERLRREAREEIHSGLDIGAIYEAMSWGPQYIKTVWDPRHPHEERFVERIIYHKDGSKTVFRNYAIIITDGVTWKAPIMDQEGRLLQIGS